MATLRSNRVAVLLGLSLCLAACGGSETPEQTSQANQTKQASQPAADDAAAWRSWLSASTQSPWQGEYVSNWDDEAAQEGSFVLLAPDSFYVQTRTALRQHSPEGQPAAQTVRVEIACDGEELRILLPAVLGSGPTIATMPADRLSALEEVDPLGSAGLFRLDSMSPWHLVRRTLDFGRAISSAEEDNQLHLQLEVPSGILARFPKDEEVRASLFLNMESSALLSLELSSPAHSLTVDFSNLEPVSNLDAARAATKLDVPKDAAPLALGPIVDGEILEATSTNLDQLGY